MPISLKCIVSYSSMIFEISIQLENCTRTQGTNFTIPFVTFYFTAYSSFLIKIIFDRNKELFSFIKC